MSLLKEKWTVVIKKDKTKWIKSEKNRNVEKNAKKPQNKCRDVIDGYCDVIVKKWRHDVKKIGKNILNIDINTYVHMKFINYKKFAHKSIN